MIGSNYKNIVVVGDHQIPLPPLPKKRSDILFIDEKKENAYWRRDLLVNDFRQIWFDFIPYLTKLDQQATIYDQDEILMSLNKEDSDYIRRTYRQEITRRREGVHFKNGDDIEWITGDQYFVLMYCKTQRHDGKGDYFDYREFQRDFFYIIYLCWLYPYILGAFISKAKKTGITNLFWLYYLNRSTMRKKKNFGYMSISQEMAAKTFNDYFMTAYNGLIPALRPEYKNKSEVNGSIIFGKAYNNSKRARMLAYSSEEELNSTVACVATKDKAFDVAVMSDVAFDEPTKYLKSFGDIWRTNKEAVKIQSKFNGRAWLFNYTPEEDSDSFREARDVFYDSELSTITPHSANQTKSGLINWHIPAYASWEGAFDIHGRCDEKRAMNEIQFERDKVKNKPREYQAIIRQYANTKKEAWGSAGRGSTFDLRRLGELHSDLIFEQKNSTKNNYADGHFEWGISAWNDVLRKNRRKGNFTEVKWVPLTSDQIELGMTDKIRMYYDVPFRQRNLPLTLGRDEWGCLIAPERFQFFLGGDPTNHAAGSEVVQGSKNGGYIISLPDEKLDASHRRVMSKLLMLEYFDRPELPDEAFEDYLMMILYTGCLALIEANAPYTATRLLEEGLGNYMLVRDKDGILCRWHRSMGLAHESNKEYQLIRMISNSSGNKEMLENLVRLIKNYINYPGEGGKDYGRTIKSDRLLKQLMDFDPTDTKLFDLVMSLGYTLLCLEVYLDICLQEYRTNNDPNRIAAILSAFASMN